MAYNRGKLFEERFREDWKRCFPKSFILRLPDLLSGFHGSNNICDFICYESNKLFLIECKSCSGASLSFENISQYNKMVQFVGLPGVRSGIILWLYDKDVVYYIPCSTIKQMKNDGKKSVGLKAELEGYIMYRLPSKKLRVFLQTDYVELLNLEEGQ